MGRTLPWATDTSPTVRNRTSSPLPKPQAKRLRNSTPENTLLPQDKPEQSRPVTPPSTKQRNHRGSRSPSSSPIRGPPPIEPMFPGYSADDIYMMVEDEFYSVAQSFTAHLHHAEYKRLKHKARALKATIPEGSSALKLSRQMSKEIQVKLRKEDLVRKQGQALEGVGAVSRGGGLVTDDEDEEQVDKHDMRKEKLFDPWRGTSLAGLMGQDSGAQHKKTSLIGLEGVPSETRAARGYKPGIGVREMKNKPSNGRDEGRKKRTRKADDRDREEDGEDGDMGRLMSIEDAIEDDDDARFQAVKKERGFGGAAGGTDTGANKVKKMANMRQNGRQAGHLVIEDNATRDVDKRDNIKSNPKSTSKSTSRLKRSFIDDFDDFDGPIFDPPSPPPSKVRSEVKNVSSSNTRNNDRKRKDDEQKDRKARLAEVPIFMI